MVKAIDASLLREMLHAGTLNNNGAARMMAIANTIGVLIDVSLSGAHQQ